LLPAPLLITEVNRGHITPVFAPLSNDNLSLAEMIVDAYSTSVESRKGEIDSRIQGYEDKGADYRFVRGLSALLERRCLFQPDASIDPAEARKSVFTEASRVNVTDRNQRGEVLRMVAAKTGVTLDRLEQTLWSDIDEHLILKSFDPVDAAVLLKQYNLSLTQTLLFKSLTLSFTASGNWKNIFRQLKRLGLMYVAEKGEETVKVTVDGPVSLLKMVDRYGTSFAKLLPQIVKAHEWWINADILSRGKQRRIFKFELTSRDAQSIFPGVSDQSDQQYDSGVEQRFASNFNSLGTGWILRREPEPLIAGRYVLIPDFIIEKDSLKVYLEIMGFWTQEYLEKKVRKLGSLRDIDMIVAVDENLACSKIKDLKMGVTFFSADLRAGDIYRLLRNREEKLIASQVGNLKNMEVKLTGESIEIADIAKTLDVSSEALKQALPTMNFSSGYVQIGDSLISEDRLARIRGRMAKLNDPTLEDVQSILEEEGVDEHTEAIKALGYEVVWHSLDISSSRLVKKKA
jgi:predicted nuclease of restriction endonuclease-like RecB superfamily